MLDLLSELLHSAVTSPWVYLAVFVAAAIDSFFPVVPSEGLVVAAGVFSVTGEPNLVAVIALAAMGTFVGDHISYGIGMSAGSRILARLPAGSRRRKSFDWAAVTLDERGGLVLVVGRFIPGMRTAATITAGVVGYSLRRFAAFDALAAVSWAVYAGLIGVISGAAFSSDPLLGVVVGLGLALAIALVAEVVRYLVRRRSATMPGVSRQTPVAVASSVRGHVNTPTDNATPPVNR